MIRHAAAQQVNNPLWYQVVIPAIDLFPALAFCKNRDECNKRLGHSFQNNNAFPNGVLEMDSGENIENNSQV